MQFYFILFFFAKYYSVNSTQHWKMCYTTNDLEQTAVVLKHKFIKCKQSVKGTIISEILKLPYSNRYDNEMEMIQ